MSDVVDYLSRIADEMERHLGPPEMAPGPSVEDLRDAVKEIQVLRDDVAEFMERLGAYWFLAQNWFPASQKGTEA